MGSSSFGGSGDRQDVFRPLECNLSEAGVETMAIQSGVIEGTAKEIKAALAEIPDDTPVRLMVGRPSLSIIARKLQSEAAARGMTDARHDLLMASLKDKN
jgi:hypothetical protein